MSDTQLVSVAKGNLSVLEANPNGVLDRLIIINFSEFMQYDVAGPVKSSLVNRREPNMKFEFFVGGRHQYMFADQGNKEGRRKAYIKIINNTEEEISKLIYKLTTGKLNIDRDEAELYAIERGILTAEDFKAYDEYFEPKKPKVEAKKKTEGKDLKDKVEDKIEDSKDTDQSKVEVKDSNDETQPKVKVEDKTDKSE